MKEAQNTMLTIEKDEGVELFRYTEEGVLKCFGSFTFVRNTKVQIVTFNVFPRFRNRGLGTKVFRLLLQEILTRNPSVTSLELYSNPLPIRFWQRQGFSICRKEPDGSARMERAVEPS